MKLNSKYDPGDVVKLPSGDSTEVLSVIPLYYTRSGTFSDEDLELIRKLVRPCSVKHTKLVAATVENRFGDKKEMTAQYCPECGDKLIYE
jgi:hypothetical protein